MDYKEMFNRLYSELSDKGLSLNNAYIIKMNNDIHRSLDNLMFEYWWGAQLEDMEYISMISLNKAEKDAANVVAKAMTDIYNKYSKEDNK